MGEQASFSKPGTLLRLECPICGNSCDVQPSMTNERKCLGIDSPNSRLANQENPLLGRHKPTPMQLVTYLRQDDTEKSKVAVLKDALEACLQFINATTLKAKQKETILITIYAALRRVA